MGYKSLLSLGIFCRSTHESHKVTQKHLLRPEPADSARYVMSPISTSEQYIVFMKIEVSTNLC
jgi:hypothetical protein